MIHVQSLSEFATEHNYLRKLPSAISWFLGYRSSDVKEPNVALRLLSIFIASMGGMLVNFAVEDRSPLYLHQWHFSSFIPSFAASCILIYGSIDAPFSQPRNFFLGHFIAGLLGLCIMKLFMTNPSNEKHLWLSATLSVAVASIVMDITGTIHPPAGATAALPSVDSNIRKLGWNYLPALLLQSLLYLGVALLCNNVFRRYPRYWMAPSVPPALLTVDPPPVTISRSTIYVADDLHVDENEMEILKAIQSRM